MDCEIKSTLKLLREVQEIKTRKLTSQGFSYFHSDGTFTADSPSRVWVSHGVQLFKIQHNVQFNQLVFLLLRHFS